MYEAEQKVNQPTSKFVLGNPASRGPRAPQTTKRSRKMETALANSWKHDRAKASIDRKIKDVATVNIVDYKRDMSLESIPTHKAYRMDAVHLYVDIPNFEAILSSTDIDGVTSHRRALRFLNLHQRAVHRILSKTGTRRVDFHNQRLHAVVS